MAILPRSVADDAELREVIEPGLALEAMRAICERHGLAATTLEPCARGSDLVYTVGERAVIKLTDPRWSAEIETEALFLEQLAGALSVEVPALVAAGQLDGWSYVVMTFLGGEHLADVWPRLSHDARVRLAAQIGELTAELHAAPVDGARAPEWPSFVREQRRNARAHHARRGATEAWLAALEVILADNPDPYAGEDTSRTLHTELLDAHIFVTSAGGEWSLSGLIDFADSMRGPASYEIAGLVEFVFKSEPELLSTFLTSYGWPTRFDEAEAERLLGCSLLHRFASLPRMIAAAGMPADGPADARLLCERLYSYQ